jgi:anti-sigma regulatory factor (Ser/Thr protein kinase)
MEHGHTSGNLEISIPAQAASLIQVREQLRAFLAEHRVREDQHHGVVLVTRELAMNAIVHGSRDQNDVVVIAIRLEPRSLLIRVLDPAHTEAKPAPLESTDWLESGRGMLIVDRLATWKQELNDGRREVTASVPLGP